jgi:hypothetical protein
MAVLTVTFVVTSILLNTYKQTEFFGVNHNWFHFLAMICMLLTFSLIMVYAIDDM